MKVQRVDILPFGRLSHIFDNTATSYKFLWFKGLLEECVVRGHRRIKMWDMAVEMVVGAWESVSKYRLSFGKIDGIPAVVETLLRTYAVPANIKSDDLRRWLHTHKNDGDIQRLLDFLPQHVPYRFLHPWIDSVDYAAIIQRSRAWENNCPYCLEKEGNEMWVVMNERWMDYFDENCEMLRLFSLERFADYLQRRNPLLCNIIQLLDEEEAWNPRATVFDFWNFAVSCSSDFRNVFTDCRLAAGEFRVDSFITQAAGKQGCIWNSLPVENEWQRSDSVRRAAEFYLSEYAMMHQRAIRNCMENHFNGDSVLDGYRSMGYAPQELLQMGKETLVGCFGNALIPTRSRETMLLAAEGDV